MSTSAVTSVLSGLGFNPKPHTPHVPRTASTTTCFNNELPDNNFRAPPPNPNLVNKNPLWAAPDSREKPDWACVGKSSGGPAYPGVRYGSAAIKPLVIVKPCACPGGVITPPLATPYGFRDSDGLWHPPKKTKTAMLVGYPDLQMQSGGQNPKSTSSNNSPSSNNQSVTTSFFSGISQWLRSLVHGGAAGGSSTSTTSTPTATSPSSPLSAAAFQVTNTNTHWIRPKSGQTERVVATGNLGFDRGASTSFVFAKYGKNPGWEPYNPDYGCVDSPGPFTGRGRSPGVRQGRFWVANVTATPCNCDNEAEMMLNNVKKPSVDVVLNPTTLQTFRQILRLDYPDEDSIPAGYMQVDSFLRSKAAQGGLKPYYEYRVEDDGGNGDYSFGEESGNDEYDDNVNMDSSGVGGPDFLGNWKRGNSMSNSGFGSQFGSHNRNNGMGNRSSLKPGRWVFHGYAEDGQIAEDGAYDQVQMLKWNNF